MHKADRVKRRTIGLRGWILCWGLQWPWPLTKKLDSGSLHITYIQLVLWYSLKKIRQGKINYGSKLGFKGFFYNLQIWYRSRFKVTACPFYTNTFILLMYEPSRIKEREYMIRTGYFKETWYWHNIDFWPLTFVQDHSTFFTQRYYAGEV